ncbi:MAG: ComF family protein [Candidatus Hydrogenedentes bacterium]|nr:ComF family protein [Candidatus Hydrogenedentota bacterium]
MALTDWMAATRNLALPIFCKLCDRRLLTEDNGFFCPECWERSPRIERPFCSMCGRPHRGAAGFGFQTNFPCAECRAKKSPAVRRVFGAASYDGAIAEAIKLFKFHDKPRLARPLAALMEEFAAREVDCPSYALLVPVPLHPVRERERGFNQSRLLAQAIQQCFPNAQLDESLRRIRPTRVQSRLTGERERRSNIAGAFAVMGDDLNGKTVLLIDDVVTTGGTVEECAKALLRAKAGAVDVMAVALAGYASG